MVTIKNRLAPRASERPVGQAEVAIHPAVQPCSSLRSDFIWMVLGNAVYAVGQWLTLVLLAKVTGADVLGRYALGSAIAVPIFVLASLQLRIILISDIDQKIQFRHYLGLRLFSTVLALLVLLATPQILGLRGQLRWTIWMVGLTQAVEAVSDIYYARLQLDDRMIRVAKSMIGRTVLSTLGLAIGIFVGRSLLWGLAGIALARTIVLLTYDIRRITQKRAWQATDLKRETLGLRFDSKGLGQILWSTLPLTISTVLVSLNATIPRYFLDHGLGDQALGIFTAIASINGAGSMVVVSLGQVAFTRLNRSYATENFAEFRSLLGKLVIFGAALGLCGIVAANVGGRQILALLFRAEYAERASLLPWMMAVGCIGYMAQFLGFGMTAGGYYHSQVVLFTFTNVVVAAGCYLLIGRLGIRGAILSMLIAAIVQLVGSIVILVGGVRKHARVRLGNVEAVPPDLLVQA